MRKSLVTAGVHIAMVSALVLWGGIGTLNSPSAPEIANVLRIQDALAGIGGIVLISFSFFRRYKWSEFMSILAFAYLLSHGSLIGLINGNNLTNILFETRILLYIILGLMTGLATNSYSLHRSITFYALIVSLAILVQWFLLLIGSQVLFVYGVNFGNIFTGNIPLVRPSSFHLVGVGLALAISPWSPWPVSRKSIWLLALALFIIQSKTYWVLAVIAVFWGWFVRTIRQRKAPMPAKTSVELVLLSLIVTVLVVLLLSDQVPEQLRALTLMPYEKLKGIFTDPEIAYGVIGKRAIESALMLEGWDNSLFYVVFGQGLGFMYRDPGVLFYRADPRDAERLAMFGHNFFLWLLLKLGLLGMLVFLGPVLLAFSSMVRGQEQQKHFGLGLIILLVGASMLGTLEDLTGAFLFGLLLAGTLQSNHRGAPYQGSLRRSHSVGSYLL